MITWFQNLFTPKLAYTIKYGQCSVGVFFDRKKAEVVARLYNGGVLEWKVDEVPEHPPGMVLWKAQMSLDGDLHVERADFDYYTRPDDELFFFL